MQSTHFELPPGAKPMSPGALVGKDELPEPQRVVDLRKPDSVAEALPKVASIPDADKSAKSNIHLCPSCGTDLAAYEEVIPSDDDKERWLRHVLGEERFTKTYPLFDGRVVVVMRSRTANENGAIYDQLRTDMKGDGSSMLDPRFLLRLNCYFLLASLASLDNKQDGQMGLQEFRTVDAYGDGEITNVSEMYDKTVAPWSEGLVGVLLQLLNSFDRLVATMVRNADNPDFWSPAGERT